MKRVWVADHYFTVTTKQWWHHYLCYTLVCFCGCAGNFNTSIRKKKKHLVVKWCPSNRWLICHRWRKEKMKELVSIHLFFCTMLLLQPGWWWVTGALVAWLLGWGRTRRECFLLWGHSTVHHYTDMTHFPFVDNLIERCAVSLPDPPNQNPLPKSKATVSSWRKVAFSHQAGGKTSPRWVESKSLVVALYSQVNLPPVNSHHEIWVLWALPEAHGKKLGDPGRAWDKTAL